MRILFTKEKRMAICEEISFLQETGNLGKVCNIVKMVGEKYNVEPRRIYSWNKSFNYIFQNDLFSDDEKREVLFEAVDLLLNNEKMSTKTAVLEISKKYNLTTKTLYSWNRCLNVFSTRQKYSKEDIILILKEIQEKSNIENVSKIILEFKDKLDVSEHTIYFWNRKFNIIDVKVYENRNEEFKLKVLKEFVSIGFTLENVKIIAKKYGVSERNIYDWNRKFEMFDTKVFKVGKNEKVKKEIIEKLETDKNFKVKVLDSIKGKLNE